jgi:aryl-phospho-beta-D-glucosidase BglC (GH1 family)
MKNASKTSMRSVLLHKVIRRSNIFRSSIRFVTAVFVLTGFAVQSDPYSLEWRPEERWRGFNLGALFQWTPQREKAPSEFLEEDFRLISEFGFNFVRLPLDYRFWTHGGDWRKIDHDRLGIVDRAVSYGVKNGVHVQICFHRIPGYCVNAPFEHKSIFKDDDALAVAKLHWETFAERYRCYSNKDVSFNLMNEPSGVSDSEYARIADVLIDAIRQKDSKRLVFSDGLSGGHYPSFALAGRKGVAQAIHCYAPLAVSHYRATWCSVATASMPPVWPPNADSPAGLLAGPGKPKLHEALLLENLPSGELRIDVAGVSDFVRLSVVADGKGIADFTLRPDEKSSDWDLVSIHPEWGGIRQGGYKRPLKVKLQERVSILELKVVEGDWCTLSGISFVSKEGREAILPIVAEYAAPVFFRQRFNGFSAKCQFNAVCLEADRMNRIYRDSGMEFLYRHLHLEQWDVLSRKGVTVMVGEFGSVEMLPAATNLAWLEDNLKLWKERNWSWAMWGFRGLFGVLDSKRPGVIYEDYKGHKLDRQMLELLQRY